LQGKAFLLTIVEDDDNGAANPGELAIGRAQGRR
jgi:hypothetical protein